jgi:AcrR family transcriptional regulator
MTSHPRPNGSRDAERTRGALLKAAQEVFASCGYAEAGVRDITARAGVNPALVSRYFGGKLALYEAALDAALDPTLITSLERQHFGKQIVDRFTQSDARRVNPLPIMLGGASDSEAREVALDLLHRRFFEPMERWFASSDSKVRTTRLMILATGFFIYRDRLPVETLGDPINPRLRDWLASEFQSIIDD